MKSNSDCLSNTIRPLKTAAKRKGTIEGFWTKTMASPPERKKKKEEIDKQSGSITNENTPAIVLDEESEYYDISCSA